MEDRTGRGYYLGFPRAASPGLSAVLIPEERRDEIERYEKDRRTRLWTVRAVVSDHVPLSGSIEEALQRKPQHRLLLNENPLTIYIHRGGRSAVYFDLIGGNDNRLSHVELRVRTDLPDRAIILSWEPFSVLLDSIVRSYPLPLVISRLELLSPETGEVIAHNLLLPNAEGLSMGPLGGFFSDPAFIPVDAIWREALNSSSPFYRLLCAYRMNDAANELRAWIRTFTRRGNILTPLPEETRVDRGVLLSLGLREKQIANIRSVTQLFAHFHQMRNAIAHFFIPEIKGGKQKIHVPISEGALIRDYSVASAALLHFVRIKIESLRAFARTVGATENWRGSILPTPDRKLDFPVHDPEVGAELAPQTPHKAASRPNS